MGARRMVALRAPKGSGLQPPGTNKGRRIYVPTSHCAKTAAISLPATGYRLFLSSFSSTYQSFVADSKPHPPQQSWPTYPSQPAILIIGGKNEFSPDNQEPKGSLRRPFCMLGGKPPWLSNAASVRRIRPCHVSFAASTQPRLDHTRPDLNQTRPSLIHTRPSHN